MSRYYNSYLFANWTTATFGALLTGDKLAEGGHVAQDCSLRT